MSGMLRRMKETALDVQDDSAEWRMLDVNWLTSTSEESDGARVRLIDSKWVRQRLCMV